MLDMCYEQATATVEMYDMPFCTFVQSSSVTLGMFQIGIGFEEIQLLRLMIFKKCWLPTSLRLDLVGGSLKLLSNATNFD